MKWKSVSPDVKRRESPKYYQPQNNNFYDNSPIRTSKGNHRGTNYFNENVTIDSVSVMQKFQEMERRERDLQMELQFYRSKFQESNHYNRHNQAEYYNNYSNPIYNQSKLVDYYSSSRETETTDMMGRGFNDINRNDDTMRYNYKSYNENYQYENGKYEDNQIEEEDEDELYFYGGKRNNTNTNPSSTSTNININKAIYNNESSEFQEYDPADFETEASSSWSSDLDDYTSGTEEFPTKTAKKNKTIHASTIETKLKLNSAKPKAYAPKYIDLDAHTYIKIPPNPIPNTWAHIIHNPLRYNPKNGECEEIETNSIVNDSSWYSDGSISVQGILMRPPFSDRFTVNHWIKFMKKLLPAVMECGYLFIWVEREDLADVVRAAERYLSFKHVENLCWIRRDLGNRLMREEGLLFNKSKMTLLALRNDPNSKCKLRHQRNPDCIIDFVGPGRMPDGRTYDVIETLLDGSKLNGPYLMHLWAGSSPTDRLVYRSRKQWIRVIEAEAEAEESERRLLETEAVKEAHENENNDKTITVDKEEEEHEDEDEKEFVDECILNLTVNNNIRVDSVDAIDSENDFVNTALNNEDDEVNDVETIFPVVPVFTIKDDSEISDHIVTIRAGIKTYYEQADTEADHVGTVIESNALGSGGTFDEDFCNFIICEPNDIK